MQDARSHVACLLQRQRETTIASFGCGTSPEGSDAQATLFWTFDALNRSNFFEPCDCDCDHDFVPPPPISPFILAVFACSPYSS
jgi:hypothetical protein